ncbi:MAG: hypothetical protein ACM3S2_20920 [Ignavibacteriales bacterium]
MLYLFLYLVLFVIWIGIELMIAPKGYEDSEGFHYGTPPKKQDKNYRRTVNF